MARAIVFGCFNSYSDAFVLHIASLIEDGVHTTLVTLLSSMYSMASDPARFPHLLQRTASPQPTELNPCIPNVLNILVQLASEFHPSFSASLQAQETAIACLVHIWSSQNDSLAEQASFVLFSSGVASQSDQVNLKICLCIVLLTVHETAVAPLVLFATDCPGTFIGVCVYCIFTAGCDWLKCIT